MQLGFEEMVLVDLLKALIVSDPDETLVLDAETGAEFLFDRGKALPLNLSIYQKRIAKK